MSAFTITPEYARCGHPNAPTILYALVVSSEKYDFNMRMLTVFGKIIANDDTGEFTWRSLGAPRAINATEVLLHLHKDGFVYQVVGDHFTTDITFPVDPEDFKQLLRDAAAILAKWGY